MAYRDPHTMADLMTEAAKALARRDPARLDQLSNHARGWMQTSTETAACQAMLNTMQEAAELLYGEPTDIEIEDEDKDEDRD